MRAIWILITIASLGLVAACLPTEVPLRIGTNIWAGYEPFYLARRLGHYRNQNIRLIELPSATDVMNAIRLGQLEGAALTLDEVITLSSEGLDLVVVMVCDISNGADVVMVRPEIKSLADLKGKRIAAETTAVGALMLDSVLAAANLSNTDVDIKYLPIPDHRGAYIDNEIDALVTFEPYSTKLADVGAQTIFDSSQINGQIVDVLVFNRQLVNNQDKRIGTVINGYFKARQLIVERNSNAFAVINQRLRLSSEELPKIYDKLILPTPEENQRLLSGEHSYLSRTANNLIELMSQQHLISRKPALSRFTTDQFVSATK
ncbi:ABC transporter substrate-binding protein [Thalassolituus sp.]|uniref:ABC transporter substrate-binding protein n=1 Tax=Thalassolituus sp. TaxID=2030822 RepID=UPI002A8270C6|nr:ABC transporter substrate-binding protein [Thalassolituus sp.]